MVRCIHCGRSSCRCGEPVTNRACSRHGATLKIVSFAQVSNRGTVWFEAAKCSIPGCKTVRNFDKGRTVRPTYGGDEFIINLQRKFQAEVRTVFINDKEQDCRPSASQSIQSNKKRRT